MVFKKVETSGRSPGETDYMDNTKGRRGYFPTAFFADKLGRFRYRSCNMAISRDLFRYLGKPETNEKGGAD